VRRSWSGGLLHALRTIVAVLFLTAWPAQTVNAQTGPSSLTLIVQTVPATAGKSFDIRVTRAGAEGTPAPTCLVDNAEPNCIAQLPATDGTGRSSMTLLMLVPDIYTVSALPTSGWALAGVSCSSGGLALSSLSVTLDFSSGAAVTCTFVYRDVAPPTVTYSGNLGTYTVDQSVDITCSATDAESGIASTTCHNIIGPAYQFNLGSNVYSATATDRAGNVGSGSTTFTVQVTPASLCALTRRFSASAGVADSLCAQLDVVAAASARGNTGAKAGALNAYVAEVQAQSGKALTSDQAATLIRLARAL
jgi:hypothetical protein